MAKFMGVESNKNTVNTIEYLEDSTALKNHVIVQNDERYEFIEGKKFSETNSKEIPIRFKPTLISEGVIEGR